MYTGDAPQPLTLKKARGKSNVLFADLKCSAVHCTPTFFRAYILKTAEKPLSQGSVAPSKYLWVSFPAVTAPLPPAVPIYFVLGELNKYERVIRGNSWQ